MAKESVAGVEYRDITNWPGYRVGSDGTVWSCRPLNGRGALASEWRPVKPFTNYKGYLVVQFSNGELKRKVAIHTIVLLHFKGEKPKGCEARHLNGNPADNRLANLKWGTSKENNNDRRIHGTLPVGSKCGMAKLKESDIPKIRELLRTGMSYKNIASLFGVTVCPISRIATGSGWTHV